MTIRIIRKNQMLFKQNFIFVVKCIVKGVDWDDNHLKVIYKSGKNNHAGGTKNLYSSESVLGRGRKRKYAGEINDDDSELENDEDEG